MVHEEIINNIKTFTPREDNLEYEHKDLDQEVQRNKIAMHIESEVKSGHLMNYLKYDASVMKVDISALQDNADLYNEIFADPEDRGLMLYLASHEFIRDNTNCILTPSKNQYSLVLGYKGANGPMLPKRLSDSVTEKYIDYITLYNICIPYTPYKSIESASHYFHISPRTYDANKNISSCYRLDQFFDDQDHDNWEMILAAAPNQSEERHIEKQLEIIDARKECHLFRSIYSKLCRGWFKQVFDFKDESGAIMMKAIKQLNYRPGLETFKNYLPVTNWMKTSSPDNKLLAVPLPDKQIMYHLDKISSSDTVVICPNLEIADQLQRENRLNGVVYTTFLCDKGCYHQVDFNALKNKQVIILAMNHSSIELPSVLESSMSLYNYLHNKEKIAEDQLSVLVAEVKYNTDRKHFDRLAQYIDFYERHEKSTVYEDSVKLLTTQQELEDEYNAAAEHAKKLEELNHPYWYKSKTENVAAQNSASTQEDGHQLMRAVCARGMITYICGDKGIGKTNFTSSMLARMVNTSQRAPEFLEERCWTPCKSFQDNPQKIVYLDYENGKEQFKMIKKCFIDPYLPTGTEARETCMSNLIIKDMLHVGEYDYSQEAHFEKFCKFLDDIAENEGTKEHPIDVLVFDTYWTYCKGHDTHYTVFEKLIKRYPQMSIIVLHHLNDGSAYGRKDKFFGASVAIELTRESKESCNLTTPFQVRFKSNRLTSFAEDLEAFDVCYDEKSKHFKIVAATCSKKEYAKKLANHYERVDSTQDELAEHLGVSINTLTSLLK